MCLGASGTKGDEFLIGETRVSVNCAFYHGHDLHVYHFVYRVRIKYHVAYLIASEMLAKTFQQTPSDSIP